jgi:nickel/cobalt exporter
VRARRPAGARPSRATLLSRLTQLAGPALLALLALSLLFALAAPREASAHPLGNFSVNHLTTVSVAKDRVTLRYVLDQAEIPTFQERGKPRPAVLAAKLAEVSSRLGVFVDGRRVPLTLAPGARISLPPGQGGLPTTRVEASFSAPVGLPARIAVRDETFPGRVGWKAVVAAPGAGSDVRSSAPSGDPTRGLRRYPKDLLSSPLDVRTANFTAKPGDGSLVAPRAPGGSAATTTNRSGDGLAGVFGDAAAGHGVLLFLLLAAFGWGALHALSPGHGKAMVAAYLVGTRGTARHAVALGATVTITHTIGVFALGLVTLALSQYILPEQLYPWLNLASGLLVVVVGLGVLRSRVRWSRGKPVAGAGDDGNADHHHAHAEHSQAVHHHHGEHSRAAHDLHAEHSHATHHHAEHSHGDNDHHAEHSHGDHHDHGAPAHGNRGAGGEAGGPAGHEHAHTNGHSHPEDLNLWDRLRGRGHSHDYPERLTWRGLIAMGASAGLIPCPSALVVLLAAVAQHQIGLGLLLIVAFSLGLATTLSVLGLLVVHARGLVTRAGSRFSLSSQVAAALPAASAVVIVGAGVVLTVRAVPGLT